MTDTIREVVESPVEQGVDEIIVYTLTTTPWSSSPTTITMVIKDVADSSNVTATVAPTGSPSAVGDVITLPAIKLLTALHSYRVEVKFTAGGNTWEPYFVIDARE